MKKDLIFRCNECGIENKIEIEDTFDLTKNEELYKSVANDSLFTAKCNKCNKNVIVEYESSYFDNLYKFYIRLTTKKDVFLLDDKTYLNIRIVNSLNELKEKLRIFYSLCDDKLIEIIKLLIKNDLNSNNEVKVTELIFHRLIDDKISFLVFSNDEYLGSINYSLDGYKELYLEYKLFINDTAQLINEDYAKNVFNEKINFENKNTI